MPLETGLASRLHTTAATAPKQVAAVMARTGAPSFLASRRPALCQTTATRGRQRGIEALGSGACLTRTGPRADCTNGNACGRAKKSGRDDGADLAVKISGQADGPHCVKRRQPMKSNNAASKLRRRYFAPWAPLRASRVGSRAECTHGNGCGRAKTNERRAWLEPTAVKVDMPRNAWGTQNPLLAPGSATLQWCRQRLGACHCAASQWP